MIFKHLETLKPCSQVFEMISEWSKFSLNYSQTTQKEQISKLLLNYISNIDPSEQFFEERLKYLIEDSETKTPNSFKNLFLRPRTIKGTCMKLSREHPICDAEDLCEIMVVVLYSIFIHNTGKFVKEI